VYVNRSAALVALVPRSVVTVTSTVPLPGGSANACAYTFGDPVTSSDPTGAYTIGSPTQAGLEAIGQVAAEGAAQQAAEDAAARREAEERLAAELASREAAEAAWQAQWGGSSWGQPEEFEEWEEEWEEDEWEYASHQPGTKAADEEARVEPAVQYQADVTTGERDGSGVWARPPCDSEPREPCLLTSGTSTDIAVVGEPREWAAESTPEAGHRPAEAGAAAA
jgi:hypothetical protein